MHAWESADPGDNALEAISARTLVMPSRTDLYFTVEDARHEAALIAGARVEVLDSDYGHAAGAPAASRLPWRSGGAPWRACLPPLELLISEH